MTNSQAPPRVAGLSPLAPTYQFLLCDIWGVLHNGMAHFAASADALARFRAGGGKVLLISNAPRPGAVVTTQLDRLGVPRTAYDGVLTSGDVGRDYLAARPGLRVLSIGPERDEAVFDGLGITLVGEGAADLVACTGLVDDDRETPDDYVEQLRRLARRGMPMLCLNPDVVVERGERLVWCAGALAARYRDLGGQTILVGKPHAPIYEAALKRLAAFAGGPIAAASLLAVGDGAETDLRGADGAGIDVLFITGGIHAANFGSRDRPQAEAVAKFLGDAGLGAVAFTPFLVW
jgi:HAD superfamily hydrolase (TIGR01459 family)